MSDDIYWCPIEHVPAEARLAADLPDASGVILLPAGTVVSPLLRDSLRKRGFDRLPLPATAAPLQPANGNDALHNRFDHRFQHAGGNAASRALYHILLQYRQEQH